MNTDLITQITEDQVQTLKALESLNINRNFIHANIEDTEDENQFVKECDLHQTFINIPCDENVIDLTQICRFCLAKRDHMQYIFNEDSGLSEAVMTISNVQVSFKRFYKIIFTVLIHKYVFKFSFNQTMVFQHKCVLTV